MAKKNKKKQDDSRQRRDEGGSTSELSGDAYLAVIRTESRYKVAMMAVAGAIWIGSLLAAGYALEPVWGTDTTVNVDIVMTVAVSIAITVSLVGAAAFLKAWRSEKERKRLVARCQELERSERRAIERAELAEQRSEQLVGDVERVRSLSS